MKRITLGSLIACLGLGCASALRRPANVNEPGQRVRVKVGAFKFAHQGVYYNTAFRQCVIQGARAYVNPLETELSRMPPAQLTREYRLEQLSSETPYPCPKINLVDTLTLGRFFPTVVAAEDNPPETTCVYAWGQDQMTCTFDSPTEFKLNK